MTVVAFPLNAVTGAPAYTGEDMRVAFSALEFGANVARPLGVRSGVRIGTPTTTASASGFTWTVANHSGIVDVQTSATAGGYLYAITTAETGAITAANATHPRRDILTIRVDDPQEDATGIPLIAVAYTAGTAAATPVVPATPARSMVLARIDTPASGGGNPTVTWLAPVTVAAGGIVPVADNTARDALSTAYGATQTLYAHHASSGLIRWPKGGAAWVSMEPAVATPPGTSLVIPSSIAGSGVALSGGKVTATAATAISINGCFTSTYDNYVVIFDLVPSASGTPNPTLRLAGTDATTAYDSQRFSISNTTVAAAQSLNASNWVSSDGKGIAGGRFSGELKLYGPAIAAATAASIENNLTANPMTAACALIRGTFIHRTATAYDGLTITMSTGNATGTVRVYGYNNS